MMALISRDPFARSELHREVTQNHSDCDWCGRQRIVKGKPRGLFQYRTETDGGSKHTHKGLFCSKDCHDSYHAL